MLNFVLTNNYYKVIAILISIILIYGIYYALKKVFTYFNRSKYEKYEKLYRIKILNNYQMLKTKASLMQDFCHLETLKKFEKIKHITFYNKKDDEIVIKYTGKINGKKIIFYVGNKLILISKVFTIPCCYSDKDLEEALIIAKFIEKNKITDEEFKE